MRFENSFLKLTVILVEPSGPINVGSVARLCANFKVDRLRIVSPKCNIYSLDTRKMSLKGINYIQNCELFDNLSTAVADCDLVIGTAGRIDTKKESPQNNLEEISDWVKNHKKIKNLALIFGREDRGLTNNELLLANKVITIGTNKQYPSLNLSHAVSIVLYELNKFSKKNNPNKRNLEIPSSKQIEDSFNEIESLLLDVGYLLNHTSNAKISKFKKYILKSETTETELNTLRGIVHQIKWKINNLKQSKSN